MKKIATLALLLSIVFGQNNAFSSIFSTEGLKITGGITYSKWVGDDMDDVDDVNWITGTSFGLEKMLPIGLVGGVTFTQRGVEMKEDETEYYYSSKIKTKINYFTIYSQYPISLGGFNAFIGGEVGFFNKAKIKVTIDGDSETETVDRDEWEDGDFKLFDYGLLVGAEMDANPNLSIRGSFYYGLADLNEDLSVKNGSFKVALIYYLGKNQY